MIRYGWIIKGQRERFVNKPRGGTRAWLVNAWRIVDVAGVDMVQPWDSTKKAARETAAQMGITIMKKAIK